MSETVIKITVDDINEAERKGVHGHIEWELLRLAAEAKIAQKAGKRRPSVVVKVDFPDEGGLELRCRTWTFLSRLFWYFTEPGMV